MLICVDEEKCKRDAICVEACGRKLIEMAKSGSVPSLIAGLEELCIQCGHCVAVCPTGALSLSSMNSEECPPIEKQSTIDVNQAEQFLRSRRSIRNYMDKPVERDKLNKLIQFSGYAPSAHNGRPVHFLIIENKGEVRRLAGLVIDWMRIRIKSEPALAKALHLDRLVGFWDEGKDPICRNAPVVIIAHADESFRLGQADCILALSYLELMAPPLDLGATWAGYMMLAAAAYSPLIESLKLPKAHKCFGIMMIGYPMLKFVRMPLRTPPPVQWR